MPAFTSSSHIKHVKSENLSETSKFLDHSEMRLNTQNMAISSASPSGIATADYCGETLTSNYPKTLQIISPYSLGILRENITHYDADKTNSQLTPSPSEGSAYAGKSPSASDITQRLLQAQPKSAVLDPSRNQYSTWATSFPPQVYYITPPSRTPEASPTSPVLFESIQIPSNELEPARQYERVEPTDFRQTYSASPSIHPHPSPSIDDYYLAQTTDSDHQDQTLTDTQRNKEPPYAELLYNCLLGAPDYQMVLKDIYEWFRAHTDKTSNPEVKGWMNSIRHNLSMNQGFEKVEQTSQEDGRRGYVWRLSEMAIREGVQSTTRYRKKPPPSKHMGSKSYRNSLSGSGSRISKTCRQGLRRSTRLQSEFLEGEFEGISLEQSEGIETGNVTSPSFRHLNESPLTPRHFASFSSDACSPVHSSMHVDSDWVYNSMSPMPLAMDTPRSTLADTTCGAFSNSNNHLRYLPRSDPTNQSHQLRAFQALIGGDEQQHLHPDPGMAELYGSDVFNELCKDTGHSSYQDPLLVLERDSSNMGGSNGLFSIPQSDISHHLLYPESEAYRMSFMPDA